MLNFDKDKKDLIGKNEDESIFDISKSGGGHHKGMVFAPCMSQIT